MGCSPYFAVTGSHPILPFDLVEATYISPPPDRLLSTSELLTRRAKALGRHHAFVRELREKQYAQRLEYARVFEEQHIHNFRDYDFRKGALVLMRNTAIEKSLDRKTKPRYLGPLIVVARNRGGAYILAELDGAVFDRPVAAYRVVPYFPRRVATISVEDEQLDVPVERVQELIDGDDQGDDEPDPAEFPLGDE